MATAQMLARRSPRVLVVGGGPVGLSMAFLLDRVYNVPTRVIERQLQPTTHPQAHFLNLRTMEVLQSTMPGFHDRLQAHAAPSELWRDYSYCTGIGKAREFARIDQFGPCISRNASPAAALASISPTQFLHFPQNRFEAMLADFLHDHALPVDRGIELIDLKVNATGQTTVALRHNSTQALETASFDYVIGADGAHSRVRELCNIDMVGASNLQSIANVHFTSTALSKAARENPAMLYFVFNKDVIGVVIAHDLSRNEWVLQVPFFPPQESLALDFTDAQCRALVQHLLPRDRSAHGVQDDTHILSVGQWRMSARVATQFDAARRVFLVGDAAHQFPPAGGFGMNTGIQDAHNLAWKLALALQQPTASSSTIAVDTAALLRSYERERQLVAKLNTQLSLRNVARTMKVPSALNVSHANAQRLTALVNSAPVRLLPLALQRDAVQRAMAIGKAPLAFLDDKASGIGSFLRQRVQQLVAKRTSLGMLFYHFDIGFTYDARDWSERAKTLMTDAALDASALFAANTSDLSTTPAPAADGYVPEWRVGGRFPHLWVETTTAPATTTTPTTPSTVSTLGLSGHVMALQTNRNNDAGDVLLVLVVDRAQLLSTEVHQLLLRRCDNDADATLQQRHVALVVLDDSNDDDATTATSDSDVFAGSFAAVHHWRVAASDAASRCKWREFTTQHAAALVRPDGHVGFLWSSAAAHAPALPSVVDALRQSFTLA